jgi:hypothetical protein
MSRFLSYLSEGFSFELTSIFVVEKGDSNL